MAERDRGQIEPDLGIGGAKGETLQRFARMRELVSEHHQLLLRLDRQHFVEMVRQSDRLFLVGGELVGHHEGRHRVGDEMAVTHIGHVLADHQRNRLLLRRFHRSRYIGPPLLRPSMAC